MHGTGDGKPWFVGRAFSLPRQGHIYWGLSIPKAESARVLDEWVFRGGRTLDDDDWFCGRIVPELVGQTGGDEFLRPVPSV